MASDGFFTLVLVITLAMFFYEGRQVLEHVHLRVRRRGLPEPRTADFLVRSLRETDLTAEGWSHRWRQAWWLAAFFVNFLVWGLVG